MKKCLKKSALLFFFLTSFLLLLGDSKQSVLFASRGLILWFEKMIPTLFPFMVLSGCIVRNGLSVKIGDFFHPMLLSFRISSPMCYAIVMGSLCGFPMGAKIISDLLETKQITKKQGEYLLAFTNNIGPLYLLSYVFPLFKIEKKAFYLCMFYLIPLIYGLLLRYFTPYKTIMNTNEINLKEAAADNTLPFNIIFFHSLYGAIEQITLLGGCMIIFNWMQIFPYYLQIYFPFLLGNKETAFFSFGFLCSLIEIGGGICQFSTANSTCNLLPIVFLLLTFGGLSCFFQTSFIIEKTGLSIKKYLFHKTIQASLIFFFLIII